METFVGFEEEVRCFLTTLLTDLLWHYESCNVNEQANFKSHKPYCPDVNVE